MICISSNKTTKEELTLYNGDYILDNICSKAVVTEELSGEYSLECVFKIVPSFYKEAYELMVNDSLITVDEEYGREYFRIAQVRKNNKEIEVFARHITISELLTMWCEDVRPENLEGNAAINWILTGAKGNNWLNVSSNISDKATAYYMDMNVYESLYTADNSFIDRWGGESYRRGFNLQINSKVGEDRGVSIRSRKNLTGFEENTTLNSLTTRIYPKGFDGITIEEKYVDSELIGNYGKIYTRVIKFDDIRVNDEDYQEGYATLEEAQEELKRRAKEKFTVDKIDVISASYSVNFVQLEKTEEYKNYAIVEKTWIGDTVKVYEEKLDINISVRVTKRQYDCKKKRRINTNLSNKDTKIKPPSIGDIVTELEKIPSTESVLNEAKKQATALINAGMKDSYVVVRANEILIMDSKDINTAVKVWRWNSGGLGYSSSGYYGEYGQLLLMTVL